MEALANSHLIVPSNLYGLINNGNESELVKIPLTTRQPEQKTQYSLGKEFFCDIITLHIVMPKLLAIDEVALASQKKKTKKRNNKDDDEDNESGSAVLDEYLLRGMVIQTIVNAMDNESICASQDMDPILYSSFLPLWKMQSCNKHISHAIHKSPDIAVDIFVSG
ncbi:hypothetical protein BT96DRAFT_1004405 [Gymnopus androsaceus JB14]|uniref:Uncharacterized protein n=1 Tax=Gymnopus androsaceus JB14 TaxID=1447944 RepID=A0A6A4GS63_9AGAR|nr:hypothetical protein BT96DRAFT_1004405 [Gymnopus androsaceus JB14]